MQRNDSATEPCEVVVKSESEGSTPITRPSLDLRVLGICTNSGLNTLDFAFVRYRQEAPNVPLRIDLLQYSRVAVHPSIRDPILNLLRDAQHRLHRASDLAPLLGRMFSGGIKIFCHKNRIDRKSIDFVSTYFPPLLRPSRFPGLEYAHKHPLTCNALIRAETGVTVIFDFAIMESGSIKPNLCPVAFVDKLLLRHPTKFRACININELVNISFIPPASDPVSRGTIARDCGPGSLLIDYAMRYCTSNVHTQDHNGTYAANGTVDQDIVRRFLTGKDYLRTAPPSNIAREMFGDHEAQRLIDECIFANIDEPDTVATVTRITAQNISTLYHKLLESNFPPNPQVDELFICGPSARNANIVDYLESELPDSVITKPLDDIGIPGDANQAVCYAHLALEAALGEVSGLLDPALRTEKGVGSKDKVKAKVIRGETWAQVVGKVQRFCGGQQLEISRDVRVGGNLMKGIRGLGLQ